MTVESSRFPASRSRRRQRRVRRGALVAVAALLLVNGGCRREPVVLAPGAPIVLIVVDTLRADSLGLYGATHATSPELDQWAKRGAVFDRAFATAPWTLPTMGSILTGRFPSSHGSGRGKLALENGRSRRVFVKLESAVPRLSDLLSRQGYATAAFVTNAFLRRGFGLAQGFDTYDQARNRFIDERRADVMVDRSLAWIDRQPRGKPWFLLVHLLDPHFPYDPPASETGKFTAGYQGAIERPIKLDDDLVRWAKRGSIELDPADRAFLRGVYDEEVAFVAAQLARFLDVLERRGVIDSGLVILTADHGEEFFDHDSLEHGHTLYQELLHVPFVVWGAEVRAARLRQPVSQVDVLPTVLDALGMARPEGIDGASLWPLLTERGKLDGSRELVAENTLYGDQRRALVQWPWKLVIDVEQSDPALYDLESDPLERQNLAAQHPEIVERLSTSLARRVQPEVDQEEVRLDAETRRELRALGYLR